jgi:site-specific recombinase XerD
MADLKTLIAQFLTACTAANLSPKTVRWYKDSLQQFESFVSTNDFQNPDTIRAYIASLHSRQSRYPSHPKRPETQGELSPNTIHGHVRALHRFLRWSHQDGKVASDLSKCLPRIQRQRHIPRGITQDDFTALVNAAKSSQFSTRNQTLLFLLRDTGCRSAEIANLKREDVDLVRGIILVRGKGGKERFAFLSPPTQRILDEYMKQSNHTDQTDYLFYSSRGRFTTATLSQILSRLKRKAGVKGRTNPHSFRHAFARDYLKAGGNLAALSQTLGHSDLTTTMIYAQMSLDDLKEQHSKYTPLRLWIS